jgi:hypothetical protein
MPRAAVWRGAGHGGGHTGTHQSTPTTLLSFSEHQGCGKHVVGSKPKPYVTGSGESRPAVTHNGGLPIDLTLPAIDHHRRGLFRLEQLALALGELGGEAALRIFLLRATVAAHGSDVGRTQQ